MKTLFVKTNNHIDMMIAPVMTGLDFVCTNTDNDKTMGKPGNILYCKPMKERLMI